MKIEILHLLQGARNATGLTVIIDVFRAFSTACYATWKGAGPIFPVGSVDEAFELKQKFSHALLAGERNERPPDGFDFGNSPFHLLNAEIEGRPLIHTTSSGTQGIVNAKNAHEIITGSFVNAGAIVSYIRQQNPERVSLVCMGYACEYPTDEDTLCAEYIRNELTGIPSDWEAWVTQIKSGSGSRFFEKYSQQWAPSEDFFLCLDRNRFDFVLKVIEEKGLLRLQRIDI
jgi:2-phosphosulfolactate phosphatase